MVHIELVQTDYRTMASHKTSCSWHRKSSTNVNMTSVCGPRAGELFLEELAPVQRKLQRSWRKTIYLWVGFWADIKTGCTQWKNISSAHGCTRKEKKGSPSWSATESPPLANALQWCAVIPVTFQAVLSLINAWQLSQDATAFNLARLVSRSLICTDKGSFATQAQQIKATLHNKYKGLYQ